MNARTSAPVGFKPVSWLKDKPLAAGYLADGTEVMVFKGKVIPLHDAIQVVVGIGMGWYTLAEVMKGIA